MQDHVAASGGTPHNKTDKSCWPTVVASIARKVVLLGCHRPCCFYNLQKGQLTLIDEAGPLTP